MTISPKNKTHIGDVAFALGIQFSICASFMLIKAKIIFVLSKLILKDQYLSKIFIPVKEFWVIASP